MRKQIKKLIKNQIELEKSYISEHEEIFLILKKLNGRQFNLRSFSKKNLKGFSFLSQYGMFYLEGQYKHLIGYRESECVSSDKFRDHDSCHGSAAIERIENLKNLDVDLTVKIFGKIKRSFNELCFLFGDLDSMNLDSVDNPIYYQILELIQEKPKFNSDLKLLDFYTIRKRRSIK